MSTGGEWRTHVSYTHSISQEGLGTAASERTGGRPVAPSASRSSLSSLSAVWLPGVGLEARPEPTTAGAMSATGVCLAEAGRLTDMLLGRR